MHDFTVLLLSDAYRSSVAATLDLLEAAERIAPTINVSPPRWRVICAAKTDTGPYGGAMPYQHLPDEPDTEDHSVWIVPGLGLSSADDIPRRMAQADAVKAIAALRQHSQNGGQVAASCSAVFLLQAAGLLTQRTATTAWLLAPALAKLAPDCNVDADQMVCNDGPITTAGAAFAQIDLMLYLLSRRLGSKLTDNVSRLLLLNKRDAQAPFITPEMLMTGNELISKLTKTIEQALPKVPKVKDLAADLCISERTLSRQINAATGKSTLALIQYVRLQKARRLIETSRMPIEQIAEQVGYQDASALRRLMRKMTGANPSQFRS